MKFSLLILTIGIPGAGKTTWAQQYKKQCPQAHIISTDEVRKDLLGTEDCRDPSQNQMIHNEARKRVKKILDEAKEFVVVVVDSTNTEVEEWEAYRNLKPSLMIAKIFNITPDQGMDMQKNRQRVVPKKILEEKWNSFLSNHHYLPIYFDLLI